MSPRITVVLIVTGADSPASSLRQIGDRRYLTTVCASSAPSHFAISHRCHSGRDIRVLRGRAIESCRPATVRRDRLITLEGFPYCTIPGYERYMIDWSENQFKMLYRTFVFEDYENYFGRERPGEGRAVRRVRAQRPVRRCLQGVRRADRLGRVPPGHSGRHGVTRAPDHPGR